MADDLMYWNGTTWVSLQGPIGPQGSPGPNKVSTDAGNTARLGSDGLVFVAAPVVNLPVASATVLGAVKIGSGITVGADGTISIASGAGYLPLAGGTMTGTINVAGATGLKWPTSGIGTQDSAGTVSFAAQDGSILFEIGTAAMTSRKPMIVPLPTSNVHAANKQYVDEAIAAAGGNNYLPIAGGTMTGVITTPTAGGTALAFPNTYSLFTANGGVSVRFGATDLIAFSSTMVTSYKSIVTPATGVGIQFGSGGAYLSKVGTGIGAYCGGSLRFTIDSTAHTSTVPVVLPADPTSDLQAATKQYVDSKIGGTGNYLPLTGGTMTGNIGLPSADPLVATHATHKGYVDAADAKKLNLTGGTMTGPINLPADPTANLQAATKQYVDTRLSTVTGTYLDTRGGAMTGPIRFAATASPSSFNGTDVYMYYDTAGNFRVQMPSGKNGYRIDNTTGICTFQYLPESGPVPTTNSQLVNKKYVDDSLAAAPTGNTNTVTAAGAAAPSVTGRKTGDLWIEV